METCPLGGGHTDGVMKVSTVARAGTTSLSQTALARRLDHPEPSNDTSVVLGCICGIVSVLTLLGSLGLFFSGLPILIEVVFALVVGVVPAVLFGWLAWYLGSTIPERNARYWKKVHEDVWERFWYCPRHDAVFMPGSSWSSSAETMKEMLADYARTTLPPPPIAPQQDIISPSKTAAKRGPSRRMVLVGLGLAGLAAVAGGGLWLRRVLLFPVGTHLYTYRGHTDAVRSVAWSPDGNKIASAGADGTVQVWDAKDGGNVFTYRGHSGSVNAVAWSPDGNKIASAGADGTVQVWDAKDGGNATVRKYAAPANAVAWSPDGKLIASATSDDSKRESGGTPYSGEVWNATDGKLVFPLDVGSQHAVAWSPDGNTIASDNGGVIFWPLTDPNNDYYVQATGRDGTTLALAWSPDSQFVAAAFEGGTVWKWHQYDFNGSFTYSGHADVVESVAWSSDSKRIASGSDDKTVQVWDAKDGGNVFTYRGHSGSVNAVSWSPDGNKIASGSSDKTVQVWVSSDSGLFV